MLRPARTLLPAVLCAALLPLTSCTTDVQPEGSAVLSGSGTKQQDRQDRRRDTSTRPGQTSEGIQGEMVEPYPEGIVPRPRISREKSWRIVPGVRYRQWDQTDRRGQVRAHLLSIDPAAPGVSIDYASSPYVQERDTVSGLLARDHALGGVNGGFFDIHDTGAPLGVGRDRQRGFLHASRYTWNNAFYFTADGTPHIGKLMLSAHVDQLPQMEITNINSPRVRVAKVGLYTPAWGRTSGYSITDGQRSNVRMVVIEDGRVVANKLALSAGKQITGTVLVGRGPGATMLRQMRVGSLASVHYSLPPDPAMAISGEKILLRNGRRLVENDRELHPRTAVGIDRDTGRILLLVVDGRQSFSRGYTMVEMARMMSSLGAEDALNLDGGGSSTMVATGRSGAVKVVNSPSDGSQRRVGDAIGVQYAKP